MPGWVRHRTLRHFKDIKWHYKYYLLRVDGVVEHHMP